jgi:hypothetical protein
MNTERVKEALKTQEGYGWNRKTDSAERQPWDEEGFHFSGN